MFGTISLGLQVVIPKKPRAYNYCGVDYVADTKRSGTITLQAHIEYQCTKYPFRVEDKKQKYCHLHKKKKNQLEKLMSVLVA